MFDFDSYKELNDMVRSAQLYYSHRKQQSEIADELGIPQSKVSRLLKRAHDEGYCKIEFNFPPLLEISAQLVEAYNLKQAVVIPTGELDNLKEELGRASARYVERFIFDKSGNDEKIDISLGLSCGLTLYQMVRQIRETRSNKLRGRLNIYPMAADNTYKALDLFPSTLAGMLAAKFNLQANAFALPAQILESLKTYEEVLQRRKEILEQSEAGKIFKEAQNVDIAFIGIGVISDDTPGFSALAKQYGMSARDLKKMGAVAEYNYVLIDKEGTPLIETELVQNNQMLQEITERIICVSLKSIRRLVMTQGKKIVCIAGGKDKVAGIRAALHGKLANVLITDFDSAKSLLY